MALLVWTYMQVSPIYLYLMHACEPQLACMATLITESSLVCWSLMKNQERAWHVASLRCSMPGELLPRIPSLREQLEWRRLSRDDGRAPEPSGD